MTFFLHSQAVSGDGSINQDAVEKLFDKNSSGPWGEFFREVFQNSNDARLSKSETFKFSIEVASIDSTFAQTLNDTVALMSEEVRQSLGFQDGAVSQDSNLLLVTDSNTSGLSGDVHPRTAQGRSNFVNFFYKLGQDLGRSEGGGSFGFGRNVFFPASRNRTIFVFTRYINELGQPDCRFMGMSAGKHFDLKGINYTGRHWWGLPGDGDTPVMPFSGNEASDLAKKFGLFESLPDGTGTVVGVLNPNHDDSGELIETLRACALVYAWPHLAPLFEGGPVSSEFVFRIDGLEIAPHDPAKVTSPVHIFYQAYLDQLNGKASGSSGHISPIEYVKGHDGLFAEFNIPRSEKTIGVLSWSRWPNAALPKTGDVFRAVGLPQNDSIALVRDARIVVRYLPIDRREDDTIARGVFVVSPNYDKVFRKSENLNHDDWSPSRLNLPRGSSNPVRQVLEAIPKQFRSTVGPGAGIGGSSNVDAVLGDAIGSFIRGLAISGEKTPSDSGRRGSKNPGVGKRPTISQVGRRLISKESGFAEGAFLFRLNIPEAYDDGTSWRVSFQPKTSLGEELEALSPAGSVPPAISKVTIGGDSIEARNFLVNRSHASKDIEVLVRFEANTRVVCDAVVLAAGEDVE